MRTHVRTRERKTERDCDRETDRESDVAKSYMVLCLSVCLCLFDFLSICLFLYVCTCEGVCSQNIHHRRTPVDAGWTQARIHGQTGS